MTKGLTVVSLAPQKKRRKGGTENTFEKITAENFTSLVKDINR